MLNSEVRAALDGMSDDKPVLIGGMGQDQHISDVVETRTHIVLYTETEDTEDSYLLYVDIVSPEDGSWQVALFDGVTKKMHSVGPHYDDYLLAEYLRDVVIARMDDVVHVLTNNPGGLSDFITHLAESI